MPIHNLGYRNWSGDLESFSTRWTVVAAIGIRRAWQSAWLKRILFFAWVPAAAMGFLIFAFERAAEDGVRSEILEGFARMMVTGGDRRDLMNGLAVPNSHFGTTESLAANRHQFWSSLLLALFQRSQAFMLIPIIGLIAPPLISQDFRSRAFLLYFSRPLSQSQYILGKAATILFYTSLVTLLPGLLLYFIGVALSPQISIVAYTWDIPLRVFAVSAMITIPCAFLSLMFSSMTTESRYASMAWFVVWICGFATYAAVGIFPGSDTNVLIQSLSLFHLFRDIGGWMLDVNTGVTEIETRIAVLVVLTIVSVAILFRRVSAPMKV